MHLSKISPGGAQTSVGGAEPPPSTPPPGSATDMATKTHTNACMVIDFKSKALVNYEVIKINK
jgi:hypothetical protein